MDPISMIIKAIFTTIEEVVKLRKLFDETNKKGLNVSEVQTQINNIKGWAASASAADWEIVRRGKKR